LNRPRVGLIVRELDQVGGLRIAAARHVRLMSSDLDLVPIAINESRREIDWPGPIEQTEFFGQRAYRIIAGDLRSDTLAQTSHLRHFAFARAIARLIEKERLDALHVFGAFELRALVGAYAAASARLPLIVSFRGIDLDAWVFGPHLAHLQSAVAAAQACVCMNESSKGVLERLFQPRCPVFTSHNYFDPADFADAQPAALPPLHPQVIGCIGEFRRILGFDFLLRAFDDVASRRDISLLLVGPHRPEEAHYYGAMMDAMKNAGRIVRVGAVEHEKVLAYLQACDVVAFPSFSDGSPNKILEAMAAGCAIVAGNVGGIPEMIRDGVDGLLVESTDHAALARAIESLLDDPDRRRILGDSARTRVAAEFNAERARRDCLAYYRAAGLSI